MSVKIEDNTPMLKAKLRAKGSLAMKRAVDDVLRNSRAKTPKADTNFLRNNTQTQVVGLVGKVAWLAAYAQYQERGMRRDGSRKVRRYTTGGTGKHFAQDAVKQVINNPAKYFKDILK